MNKQVRVNVRSLANTAAIRKEKRNGRDVIIVPSATLPDNVVMNGIKYPADEIEKSYTGLERKPAPLGHPVVNGEFVSASDPEGINGHWVGAWNEKVRRENGRVWLDKVIDVQRANSTDEGKRLLDAIDKGDPIHTSNALMCDLEEADDKEFSFIARNMVWDHDAFLLDEEGAAKPEQGVGVFVNSSGAKLDVINSALDAADQELDWAGMHLLSALERRERANLWERIKSAVMEALPGTSERETSNDTKETDMTVSQEQFDTLSAEVKALSERVTPESLANAVAEAVKPLTDNLAELQNAQKAKDDAELSGLQEKIVKANLMDEATAKELTLNAARKLAEGIKDGKAAPLNSAFNGKSEDNPWKGYSMNSHIKMEA